LKTTHRILTAILLAAFLCFGGACGPKKKVIRVVNFMTDPILIAILAEQVHQIEKENPELEVRLESIRYSDYQQKIMTQAAAHNVPDVLFVEVNNFVNLYYQNVFEDLTPYLKKDKVDIKKYYGNVVGRFTREGKLYALPQDIAPSGLVYYNKKAFREAGLKAPKETWTWPEPFLSICKKLMKKNKDGKVVRWAYCDPYSTDVGNFVYSAGAGWVDNVANPRRCTVDSPAFLRAARFRWDLIHKHHVSPDPSQLLTVSAGAGVDEMFAKGQVALMSSGIWHTPRFLKEPDLEFDVVPFPKGPGGKQGWSSGGSGYAISRESKNKEDAWKVIRAITGEATIKRMAATGFIQPALVSLAKSNAFLRSPGPAHKNYLLKMPLHSNYQPFCRQWNEIQYGLIGPAMDRVWNGDAQPEPVLRDLAKKANEKFFSKP
jgi:multiple sugar transport system substrate-binding protein